MWLRKGYSAHNSLLYMMEKMSKISDYKGVFAAGLTDIFKAFDCISHEVLLAKLHAYGSNTILVTFMHTYLNQRRQTKVHLLLLNS